MLFARVAGIVAALALVATSATTVAQDTLVICPAKYRAALVPWENYRQGQGHAIHVIAPPRTSDEVLGAIRAAARGGELRYVVLVGDVDLVPTAYARATVNVLWGSEPTIATDQFYGDVDGDGGPDVAVGRIPADSAEELSAVIDKVIRYEQQADQGSWRRQIDVVAGVGGFGVMTDALIEAAARNVFRQVVPANYNVRQLKTNPDETCAQISAGAFAWIYLGHGLPTMTDVAQTPRGPRPILSTGDVAELRCGANCPLAVLVACYTGAIDARDDSLGEALVVEERGPVAAIAATRVTMPYGNTVLGCELLRAAFAHPGSTLGAVWLAGQRAALADSKKEDSLRTSLDSLARGVSPPPVDLAAERREHVLLYQLLGDPLTRLNYPQPEAGPAAKVAAASETAPAR